MKFFALTILLSFGITYAVNDASPCGDWEQYKDEHCYKLFGGLQSYSDAEKVCQANNSSMVSIHYAEEQQFLSSYIFIKKKAVDNVWIGARYVGNKLFQWVDNTTLQGYSNWAPGFPKNLAEHCVQMLVDEGSLGKWAEERCVRRNMVVCQKLPLPSIWAISQTVIELKHSLQLTASKLQITESELEKTKQTLTTKQSEMEAQIVQLKKESIPVGFIYVQLPKDKLPAELWPNMTWKDISADYEGVFFRVVGGDAASFGQVQQANAPRLETVHNSYTGNDIIKQAHYGPYNLTIPITGWSDGIYTGTAGGSSDAYFMNFKHSDIAEVRPKNMAIKVYKRTA